MATIVGDEHELFMVGGEKGLYIRSKCDPTFLIAGRSGDVFVRRDGQPWEWPGYRVSADEVEPKTAHEDTQQIKPKQQAA